MEDVTNRLAVRSLLSIPNWVNYWMSESSMMFSASAWKYSTHNIDLDSYFAAALPHRIAVNSIL